MKFKFENGYLKSIPRKNTDSYHDCIASKNYRDCYNLYEYMRNKFDITCLEKKCNIH
jgi:hypothetical protein